MPSVHEGVKSWRAPTRPQAVMSAEAIIDREFWTAGDARIVAEAYLKLVRS